jgi:hypothetical protein
VAFAVFVPPLLFRAATTTSVREIRDHLRSVALLAVGLVLATTVTTSSRGRSPVTRLRMQRHYSTAQREEMRQAVGRVISLAVEREKRQGTRRERRAT